MFNGWKNYKTWNVALHISNDERLYNLARTCSDYLEFSEKLHKINYSSTPDSISWYDENLDIEALNELIKNMRTA